MNILFAMGIGMVIADSNLPQEILASGDETINADVSAKR